MTDNRDIDEILASLDALLREGDSHNDDMPVEPVESTRDIDALEEALETDIASMQADAEESLGRDEVDNGSAVEVVPDHRQEGRMSRVVLTEDMMVENPQVSLPLGFHTEVLKEDDVTEGEPSVLEALSLDEVIGHAVVQQGVVDDGAATGENELPEPTVDDHIIRLHKEEFEQLLALVSLDVSRHLQEILPKLMKESLHAHLADMQHESDENNKTSDDE